MVSLLQKQIQPPQTTPLLGFLKIWRDKRGPRPSSIIVVDGRLPLPPSHEYRNYARAASTLLYTEQILCKGERWRELSSHSCHLQLVPPIFYGVFFLFYKISLFNSTESQILQWSKVFGFGECYFTFFFFFFNFSSLTVSTGGVFAGLKTLLLSWHLSRS